jgi:hypothetical protein
MKKVTSMLCYNESTLCRFSTQFAAVLRTDTGTRQVQLSQIKQLQVLIDASASSGPRGQTDRGDEQRQELVKALQMGSR